MARMKKQVLGSISGALNDIVFRERHGKNYAAMRPASYNTPMNSDAVNRRTKFKMAVELARAINAHLKLKDVWKPLTPTGLSAYNFLVKSNYFRVSADAPGNFVEITPSGGFPVQITNVELDSAQFDLTISAIGTNSVIDPALEINIQCLSVLFMSSPTGEEAAPYTFLSLSSDVKPLSLTDPVSFVTLLNSTQSEMYNQYNTHKIYYALITLNAEGKPVHYSVTLNHNP